MEEGGSGFVIAHCGLVCSECGAFVKGRCDGCHSEKPKFRNCPVKRCNLEHAYVTCADCQEFGDLGECKKLNNWISKLFGLIFRSDRMGNLNRIRQTSLEEFSSEHS